MRGEWFGWSGSVAVSVGIHAVAIALLLFEFGTPPPPIPPVAAPAPMVVDLAPMPTTAAAVASDTPDGPEQQEQEQATLPHPAEKPPLFDPPPKTTATVPDALPVPPDTATPSPPRVQAAQRATAPAAAAAPTPDKVAQAPVAGASADQVQAANESWENRLLAHLQRYKRYPASARALNQEDVIFVQFTIDRTGRVLSSRLKRSRGFAPLDQEVALLMRRASPLPAPPPTMGGTTIEMMVPIEFYLRSPSGRR